MSIRCAGRRLGLKHIQPRGSIGPRLFSSSISRFQDGKPAAAAEERTTHFGFQNVAESLKESKVRDVFNSVAKNYDTMNDAMSFGIHRLWKDQFVQQLNPGKKSIFSEPMTILDLAGGTGDIAFRMLDHARTVNGDPETRVKVVDINEEMLREGMKRAHSLGYRTEGEDAPISFLVQNGETLEAIPDNSIDLLTIAFGIRNFTDKEKALATAYRVLKKGGVFACLEFSKVNNFVLDQIYQRYSFSVIPMMGQLIAGDRDSYQYLVESIVKFPSQKDFARMIQDAGFQLAGKGWQDLTFGVAAIHTGVKL
ncbi:2-hexaprenyl-6-methoxy-1,4-benzoquinone methyltransferase [Orbilia brochopaga]|uniref:2-methoxy-6-polyprenyl-1,4-benzoquinol methylase, mitochondrial n=1 Tax=Orbilia brochopaga TaxID=3140254 RepID=A0AAV9V659_9PEZI